MNTLRNYLLVFTMALMSVCFVACGNNTTTDNETTTATNQSHLLKILRRVEIQEKLTTKMMVL